MMRLRGKMKTKDNLALKVLGWMKIPATVVRRCIFLVPETGYYVDFVLDGSTNFVSNPLYRIIYDHMIGFYMVYGLHPHPY